MGRSSEGGSGERPRRRAPRIAPGLIGGTPKTESPSDPRRTSFHIRVAERL